ncbi:hypothetical protein ACQ9QE_003465, partial [Cronobacter sakazakii]
VKRRPKGAFLLICMPKRFEPAAGSGRAIYGEATEPLAATARRASEASHPARPTSVKRRPKGAFLLFRRNLIRTLQNAFRHTLAHLFHPMMRHAHPMPPFPVTFAVQSAILFSI